MSYKTLFYNIKITKTTKIAESRRFLWIKRAFCCFLQVIQNYQDDLPSSSKNSTSSRHSNAAKAKESKEYFFSNQTLDSKWKHSDGMEDTSSISSSDECLRSESSTSINCAGDVCLTVSFLDYSWCKSNGAGC